MHKVCILEQTFHNVINGPAGIYGPGRSALDAAQQQVLNTQHPQCSTLHDAPSQA